MSFCFLFTIASIILLVDSSCEKNGLLESNNPEKYYPLSVGNFWVYESSYTTNGGNKASIGTDSIVVKKDTIMRGQTYYLVEGTFLGNRPYKEYLTYVKQRVISINGKVWFEGTDFGSIVNSYASVIGQDTSYSEKFYMERPGLGVSVPAGKFETLALVGIYKNPTVSDQVNIHAEWHYAKDIGLIRVFSDYITAKYIIEMDLVEYHVE